MFISFFNFYFGIIIDNIEVVKKNVQAGLINPFTQFPPSGNILHEYSMIQSQKIDIGTIYSMYPLSFLNIVFWPGFQPKNN